MLLSVSVLYNILKVYQNRSLGKVFFKMASKMVTETFEWPYVCNYQLKIDDLGVYLYVFGGKEYIEAIKKWHWTITSDANPIWRPTWPPASPYIHYSYILNLHFWSYSEKYHQRYNSWARCECTWLWIGWKQNHWRYDRKVSIYLQIQPKRPS